METEKIEALMDGIEDRASRGDQWVGLVEDLAEMGFWIAALGVAAIVTLRLVEMLRDLVHQVARPALWIGAAFAAWAWLGFAPGEVRDAIRAGCEAFIQ